MTDNRLTPEELNSFSEWLPKFLEEAAHHQETINRQKAEIERLECLANHHRELINELNKGIAEAKAEAVKEFAKILKDHYSDFIDDCYYEDNFRTYIDNLVEEMAGENYGT